jgi:hypothetical protein
MIHADADAAPAKERVVFFDREIRQRFVATDVERAHRDHLRMEGFQLFTVDLSLFTFSREAFAQHEGHFGAEQTDAFGAALA